MGNSPYTSAAVDNVPTGTDIIALQFAGNQTLAFSETIANPVSGFVSLVWRSLTNEYWNGFTVGVQGTDDEVFAVPEPASMMLLGSGLTTLYLRRRRKSKGQAV